MMEVRDGGKVVWFFDVEACSVGFCKGGGGV